MLIQFSGFVLAEMQAPDRAGTDKPSGIVLLEEITLGGAKQWILIRSEDATKPVLLFLHGGPGFSEMPFSHMNQQLLERHFVVVNWDQRGAGKSHASATPETMKIEQFFSDTHELIELLRSRFSQDKVFLIGHSWGSVLGIETAHRHPELLHAYVGMGQVVNMQEGETISYRYTLEKAREAGDVEAIEALEKIGPPPYEGGMQSTIDQRVILGRYGGTFQSMTYPQLFELMQGSQYHSPSEFPVLMRAMGESQAALWDELMAVDFTTSIRELRVPVFFIASRHDYQTPSGVLERYFQQLQAPIKEIAWFENSGHFPNIEEPEKYQEFLIDRVLQTALEAGKPAAETPAVLQGFPEFVEATMADWNIPGLAVAIINDGEVVFERGFGYRDVENQLPVTPGTLFAIGSATKTATATAVAMLVDDGLLDLDTPLIDYLPGFRLADEHATTHVTARDILCHRSGVPGYDAIWLLTNLDRRQIFERLGYLEPIGDIRERFQYSNLMYMVAGELMAELTNGSWESFVSDRIFSPLEMNRSNFSTIDSQAVEDHAQPYFAAPGHVHRMRFRDIDSIAPAGAINSCLEDMTRWLMFQLDGGMVGGGRLLSRAGIEEMQTPQMVIGDSMYSTLLQADVYGLGWAISDHRGHRVVSHDGSIDGFSAQIGFMPDIGTGVVVLSNSMNIAAHAISRNVYDRFLGVDGGDWNDHFLSVWRGIAEGFEDSAKNPEANCRNGLTSGLPLAEYVGRYQHPAFGSWKVSLAGEHLNLVTPSGLTVRLEHCHEETYYGETGDIFIRMLRLRFHLGDDGTVHGLSIPMQPGVDSISFERFDESALVRNGRRDLSQ